jgi:BCD family chlorophyll transporter-like MFS transporter
MFINHLVLKLGLIRFATSLLVVLLANVLNRVLIVDLLVPATLVTFAFAFQHVMTPAGLVTGYFSDAYALGRRHRAPYIWGGMLLSVAVTPFFPYWAQAWGADPRNQSLLYEGVLLFSLFGIGTTVSATAINALLVDRLPEAERGSALTLLWILTLAGFIVGSVIISHLFPEYDAKGLYRMFGLVTAVAVILTLVGVWGIEPPQSTARPRRPRQLDFWQTLKFLGGNVQTLAFFAFLLGTIFFLAIQTFLLTAFGGEVLALPVAQTSKFGVYVSYGVLLGMVGLHLLLSWQKRLRPRLVLAASLGVGALAFGLLSLTSFKPHPTWGLYALWFLGLSRGLYNVGLSHLTMSLAHPAFSGIFMGLWNLVSGLALAAGEMMGGVLKDRLFGVSGTVQGAYGWVFLLEGVGLLACILFLIPLKREKYQRQLVGLLGPQLAAACQPGKLAQAARHPDESG